MIWIVTIMVILAVLLLYLGIVRQKQSVVVNREQQNIEILRQQLAELKLQHESGEVSDEAFQQSYDELALTLQKDMAKMGSAQSGDRFQRFQTQRVTGFIILLCIGIITPVLYFSFGNPDAINPADTPQQNNPHQAGHNGQASIDVMVERLEKKMQTDPDNAAGWYILGRSYMVMRKYDKAVSALEHAFKLNASDPDVLVTYADALAMQQGGGITGKSFQLVKQALELDPTNRVALWLTAMGYEAKDDYKTAVTYWQRLLPLMQAEPQQYAEVQMRLQNAGNKAGIAVETQPLKKPLAAVQLKVSVSLAEKFKQGLNGSETVFVFARAAKGPPQPLAARRMKVSDLPVTFIMDDSMAMMPTNKLSDHQHVYVGARVSRSGNPIASSGDIQGRSKILDMQQQQGVVQVIIDQEVL